MTKDITPSTHSVTGIVIKTLALTSAVYLGLLGIGKWAAAQPTATPCQWGGTSSAECVCRSTDGRNRTCVNNGCVEPPNHSMMCYFHCDTLDGRSTYFIRGIDGAYFSSYEEMTRDPGSFAVWRRSQGY